MKIEQVLLEVILSEISPIFPSSSPNILPSPSAGWISFSDFSIKPRLFFSDNFGDSDTTAVELLEVSNFRADVVAAAAANDSSSKVVADEVS